MPYWRLHYHLVWGTNDRAPLLVGSVERDIHGALLGKARELGIIVHAVGNTEDHIHLAVSIPPKLAVADCIKHFKGASSFYVNHRQHATGAFGWQDGYGALTFGDQAMSDIVAYVSNQKQHHADKTTRTAFERMTAEDEGVRIVIQEDGL